VKQARFLWIDVNCVSRNRRSKRKKRSVVELKKRSVLELKKRSVLDRKKRSVVELKKRSVLDRKKRSVLELKKWSKRGIDCCMYGLDNSNQKRSGQRNEPQRLSGVRVP
jgi:hypothetical protein